MWVLKPSSYVCKRRMDESTAISQDDSRDCTHTSRWQKDRGRGREILPTSKPQDRFLRNGGQHVGSLSREEVACKPLSWLREEDQGQGQRGEVTAEHPLPGSSGPRNPQARGAVGTHASHLRSRVPRVLLPGPTSLFRARSVPPRVRPQGALPSGLPAWGESKLPPGSPIRSLPYWMLLRRAVSLRRWFLLRV